MTRRIAVIAANGRAGRLIVEEAVRRHNDVTAVTRSENRTAAEKSLVKDIFDLTAADLAGFDAVVDEIESGSHDRERISVVRR